MVSFGNKALFEFNICYNHTINKAVEDVIFPKAVKKKRTVPVQQHESSYSDEEEEDEAERSDYEIEEEQEIHVVNESFQTTIDRMKTIINAFRKSPVRNGLLQVEIKKLAKDGILGEELKKKQPKLQLKSFTKTRWNSLVISGKQFLLLLPAVQVTISELDSKLVWEDDNTEELEVGALLSTRLNIYHK